MKKALFFENAKLLKEKFDIVPLMYGSLGLEYLTGESFDADDIDILIPEVLLTDRWCEFKESLINEGYVLYDEHEHTFIKNEVSYSYASLEELENFAGIKSREILVKSENNVKFRLLSLDEYLRVYQKSIKDGYRVNVRKKKDKEKIDYIESLVK